MDEPLVRKMLDRLGRAIASEEMREKMNVEDELDRIFGREMGKMAAVIAEKEEIIAEKEEIIAEKDHLLMEERKRAEAEIQKNLELQRQIEALKNQLKQ